MNLPDGLIDGHWTVLGWCLFAIAAGTLRQRAASFDSVRAQESWRWWYNRRLISNVLS